MQRANSQSKSHRVIACFQMVDCPKSIDGAKVISYTPIDSRHRFTGKCKQIVAGQVMGPMAALVICQYEGEDGFNLFGCDAEWNAVTDTWHGSIDEAKSQAEFEYEGISNTWIKSS